MGWCLRAYIHMFKFTLNPCGTLGSYQSGLCMFVVSS